MLQHIHSEWCALEHQNDIYYERYVLLIYTGVSRRILQAEGGVERELAKRENEMGSPVDKTVYHGVHPRILASQKRT